MPTKSETRLLCTCEGTMAFSPETLGNPARPASQLCRAQLDNFRAALGRICQCDGRLHTRSGGVFRGRGSRQASRAKLRFANIRETAGWSEDGANAGPKMAAILAMAEQDVTPVRGGQHGKQRHRADLGPRSGCAETRRRPSPIRFDITVLLLPGSDVTPPRQTTWPVLQGRVGGVPKGIWVRMS